LKGSRARFRFTKQPQSIKKEKHRPIVPLDTNSFAVLSVIKKSTSAAWLAADVLCKLAVYHHQL
jgi:hypothetical protein